MPIDPSIPLAARVLGTLVFGMAVIGKMRHREEFVGVVANYRLLPEALVAPIAWLIIALETATALLLASGVAPMAGAVLAVTLLCAFAAAMAVNLARGRKEIDCGCFQSALRQRLSGALVVRNLLLVPLFLSILLNERVESLALLQVLDGIGGGVVLFVLYLVFGQVLALRDAAEALRKRFG